MAAALQTPDGQSSDLLREAEKLEIQMFNLIIFKCWHHSFDGHELGQTPGGGEGQGSLSFGSSRGSRKIGHNLATEQQHDTAITLPPQASNVLEVASFIMLKNL